MDLMTGFCAGLTASLVGLLAGVLPQSPVTPVPLSALPLRLTGTMVDARAPVRSACLIRCADGSDRGGMFYSGEQACDLAEIQEIREDGVVVRNLKTNRLELLVFPAATNRPRPLPEAAAARPPAAPPSPSQDVVVVELPKGAIDRYLGNLPALLESAVATPRYRDESNGQRLVDGYEISQVQPGGVADQLGLRSGDVILEVNGQPLDGVATVMRLFGEVRSMPQAKLAVLRSGQRITLVVDAKRDE
jgi:type II secretory pathway component PulC